MADATRRRATRSVFSTGDVHLPDNAERTVYINEQVERETDIDRRLDAEAVLGTSTSRCPSTTRSSRRGTATATRAAAPRSPRPPEVPSPKGEPVALKDARVQTARRLFGRRGGSISTTGSFSLGHSSNRSGNDR
ncbi:hypothetical protein JL722_12160 [Aureococcus anophagefferens]|nr:hypothetical protein JL722_12160 [Aureococcus anophagefferens]